MLTNVTQRLRNVNAFQAGSILYGDWGTSKAYVIGLAFALNGYSSFWLILGVCIVMAIVALNYIKICELYPNGGGVYASVRHRSKTMSLLGAFFLIADYLVTAALSALSAFSYLGVSSPLEWALIAICIIGALNFFGPRHTGTLAFAIVIPTLLAVIILGLLSLPELPLAIQNLRPLSGGIVYNWNHFVTIIIALSGIESIANITGVMQLDPGSTKTHPQVKETATKAIIWVMIEVCFFTALFGLAVNALPGLTIHDREVYSPEQAPVRDYMLRYMGEVFGSNLLGPLTGKFIGIFISLCFGALLLSAVNTAMIALTSLLYVMSRDQEMPEIFSKLNRFGVPVAALLATVVTTFILLITVKDIVSLADLYAVGFVGAIVTNLGSTSTDLSLDLKFRERAFMFGTFLVLLIIEISLLIDKPHARIFVTYVFAIGLFLRNIMLERRQEAASEKRRLALAEAQQKIETRTSDEFPEGSYLCAIRGIGKTLEFSIQEANKFHKALYILYIGERRWITEFDQDLLWNEDENAKQIYQYVKSRTNGLKLRFEYIVSDAAPATIAQKALELKVSRVILGMSQRTTFYHILYGNVPEEVQRVLPKSIELVVVR